MLYPHIILPNLNTSAACSHISYSAYLEWRSCAAPTLTVALLSRRYIAKEDYLVRKFSSLTALARDALARSLHVRSPARSSRCYFASETKCTVGRLAKPRVPWQLQFSCNLHYSCEHRVIRYRTLVRCARSLNEGTSVPALLTNS